MKNTKKSTNANSLPAVMLVTITLTMTFLPVVQGHGRLMDPPSRSSMWRVGFSTPKNYDDNALNCGGLNTQWYMNGGKCGVCGDPWDQPQPRENEAGGRYGTGTISKTYTPGQVIDVRVDVTANHKGWFEFRLCVHNSPTTPITQQCLDQHLLPLADGSGTRYTIDPNAGTVNLKLQLPAGLTCSQCVLQWKYHGGNNFGDIQEEFYGCSDIAIGASGSTSSPPTTRPTLPHNVVQTTQPTAPTPGVGQQGTGNCHAIGQFQGAANIEDYCKTQCPLGNCPPTYCTCSQSPITSPTTTVPTLPTTPQPLTSVAGNLCHAIGQFQGVPNIEQYCQQQCPLGNCPSSYCSCSQTPAPTTTASVTTPSTAPPTAPPTLANNPCHAVGNYTGVKSIEEYCRDRCPLGDCPPTYCSCYPVVTTPQSAVTTSPPVNPVTNNAYRTTQTTAQSTPHMVCKATGYWTGVPELDLFCNEQCPLGNCPSQCSCTGGSQTFTVPTTIAQSTAPPSTTTAPPLTTRAPPPTTTTLQTSTAPPTTTVPQTCHAVGQWVGNTMLEEWCKQTCPYYSGCDPQYCQCSNGSTTSLARVTPGPTPVVTTPSLATTTSGKCVGINAWAGNPAMDNYCEQQCKSGGPCPAGYCSCANGTTTSATTTPPGPTVAPTGTCYAINAWANNPDLDHYCEVECKVGLCPPQYCACGPAKPQAQANTTPPPATTTPPQATTTPPPPTLGPTNCQAIPSLQGSADMNKWCRTECALGNCPPSYCTC